MNAPMAPIVPQSVPARSTSTSTVVAIVIACVVGALLVAGAALLALTLFLGVSVQRSQLAEAAHAQALQAEHDAQAARAAEEAARQRAGTGTPTPR